MNIISKKCGTCKKVKKVSLFTKNKSSKDGYKYNCIKCCKIVFRKWMLEKHSDEEYMQKLSRKKCESINTILNKKDENFKLKIYLRTVKFKKNNPEKCRSWWIVNNAVRYGKISKQPCEVCGSVRVEAHHEDYSKPLLIKWLCHRHHMFLSRGKVKA